MLEPGPARAPVLWPRAVCWLVLLKLPSWGRGTGPESRSASLQGQPGRHWGLGAETVLLAPDRPSVRPSTLAAASSHLTCGARCTERDGLRADGSFRGCFPAAASAEMPRNSGRAHLRFRPHPAAPSSPCSSGPSLARASGFIN